MLDCQIACLAAVEEKPLRPQPSTSSSSTAEPESGLVTDRVSLPSATASFTARPRSDEIVETRSTASWNGLRSTMSRLSLPFGMTRR